jgi:hypothetical protein
MFHGAWLPSFSAAQADNSGFPQRPRPRLSHSVALSVCAPWRHMRKTKESCNHSESRRGMVCGHAPATLPTERVLLVRRWVRRRAGMSVRVAFWNTIRWRRPAHSPTCCDASRLAAGLQITVNDSKSVAGRFLTFSVTHEVGGFWLSRLQESQT